MKFHIEFGMLLYLGEHVLSLNVRSCESAVFSHSLNGNGGGKEHMTFRSFRQPYTPIVLPFESLSYYDHFFFASVISIVVRSRPSLPYFKESLATYRSSFQTLL